MLFQHSPWVVRPFTLSDGAETSPFGSQIQPADAGKQ
jgi:hypothetical protein